MNMRAIQHKLVATLQRHVFMMWSGMNGGFLVELSSGWREANWMVAVDVVVGVALLVWGEWIARSR